MSEELLTCPDCGQSNFLPRGLAAHRGNKTCLARQAPESNTLTVVAPGTLTVMQPDVPLHNLYHRNGMLATAQGACWLVLAGVELLRQRDASTKRGARNDLATAVSSGWEKWVEDNCEFNIRTAQRYIALAMNVKEKALKASFKTNLDSFLELLQTPAQNLSAAQQIQLLQSVHKLTDGATISQLYLDFGITKKPQGSAGKGGDLGGGGASRQTKAELAIEEWEPLVIKLEILGLEERTWGHLPDHAIKRLRGVLIDLAKLIPDKQ